MLILDATTKSIEVSLAAVVTTNQLPIVVSYADIGTNPDTFVPGGSDTVTNSTTPVTAVAAPGASKQRQVKGLTVQNADTVAATVIVRFNNNATLRTIVRVAIAAGSTLVCSADGEWSVIDSGGATDLVTLTGAQVLTNKQISPRLQSLASAATVTAAPDTEDLVVITAQAEALVLANPTPVVNVVQGQKLIYRIKDNGTARAITYGSQFRAMGTALPSTTVLGKTLYLGLIYNITDTKWDLVASAQEA